MCMTETEIERAKPPRLIRNFISLFGSAIVVASLISITLLFLSELFGRGEHPYFGIFTYIILPGVMMMGLAIVLAGMLLARRRRRRLDPSEIGAFPKFDLNDPRRRRSLVVFLVLTFVFLFVRAFGSSRPHEY